MDHNRGTVCQCTADECLPQACESHISPARLIGRHLPADGPRVLLVGIIEFNGQEPAISMNVAAEGTVLQRAHTWPQLAGLLKEQTRRGQRCDLLVVGTHLADGSTPWALVTALKRARPWQAWILMAPACELSRDLEMQALELGAAGVFDALEQWQEVLDLAWMLHQRQSHLPTASRPAEMAAPPV